MFKNSLAIATLPEKAKVSATTTLTAVETSHCNHNHNTPSDLEQWARQDWEASGAGELFDANVEVVEGNRAFSKILYSEKLRRTNTGRLAGDILEKNDHLWDGGWYIPVLDPQTDFAQDDWGCLKPIRPRTKQDGLKKNILKYEHPYGEPVQPFFLKITYPVWLRIAKRYGLEIPAILPQPSYGKEFWEWVIANNLPVVITEGVKKTASLLCAGYVAIGVPGIWNFSEKIEGKDSYETPLKARLKAFYSRFTQPPEITIAYDADHRPQTVKNITLASTRLAKKLQWNVNADVKIARWHPELGKGIDDVLMENGLATVETILDAAIPNQTFCFVDYCQLSYPVTWELNQRYLGQIPEFNQKIIGIKSPKNTGKTYALAELCNHYTRNGIKVIVISHRVQLASELANRLGIEFINEIKTKDQWLMASLQGFVLCIDSLHPQSKAKIDLTENADFDDAVVIVDESEQVLNHLVNSTTLKRNRAKIVEQLEILCKRSHKIYLSDADLSDYSINFFRNLANLGKSDIAIINNQYQFSDAWNVYLYTERTPERILLSAQLRLQKGKRIILHVSGQKAKSLFSAQNVLKRLAPYCQRKTLLLDSHSIADPEHEAYGITSKLNELTGYQLVVATPVIETGVSIEADLFDQVFCISYGVQSVQSVSQALARYRRPVARHVWIQQRPANMMKFGGVVSEKQCHHYISSNKKRVQKVISEFPTGMGNGLYDAYTQFIVRFNLGHQAYRENLKYLLTNDGHQCTEVEPLDVTDDQIRQIRNAAYEAEIDAIVESETPTDSELETLNNAVAKTKAARYKERKGNLIRTYGNCSKELVKADDDGCFKPLQLLYYLTAAKTFLSTHDSKQCKKFTSKTQSLDHEIGASVLGVKVAVLKNLGIEQLLDGKPFSNDHPVAKIITNVAPGDFLATFGRKLPSRGNLPSRTGDRFNTFLDLIGFKKEYVGRVGTGPNAVRHYRAVPKFGGIGYQEIFDYWRDRDRDIAADNSSDESRH